MCFTDTNYSVLSQFDIFANILGIYYFSKSAETEPLIFAVRSLENEICYVAVVNVTRCVTFCLDILLCYEMKPGWIILTNVQAPREYSLQKNTSHKTRTYLSQGETTDLRNFRFSYQKYLEQPAVMCNSVKCGQTDKITFYYKLYINTLWLDSKKTLWELMGINEP